MGRLARPTGEKEGMTKAGPNHKIEEEEEQAMCVRDGKVHPGRTLRERR